MNKLTVTLVSMLISLLTINPAYAADAAYPQLHMKITNTIKGQKFALCLSESCYFLNGGEKNVALDGENVDSIIMTNVANMQMYPQSLPKSCQVTVKPNQTLTVSGTLVAKKTAVFLNNTRCAVTTRA